MAERIVKCARTLYIACAHAELQGSVYCISGWLAAEWRRLALL
jgi:hypothetical protein